MALETKTNLTDETVEELQGLIQINLDSQLGFDEAASEVEKNDASLAKLFRTYATERSRQASELKSFVSLNNTQPRDDGSFSGSAHRGWINLKAALGGGKQMILNEAERGEDAIKAKYEEVLKSTSGSGITDVLNRHYAEVKRTHDKVRDLRDQCKNDS